ncbi:folylpolyglutamate synthase/dihydrofolate synthase family protein [Temperatibacter marinus]|uniref:tetrahydrofolate synthase n=1 Tax=Temperatibacter marinus TaxID=1456591 RepID=A0AA52HAT8_9PROT|nr:folylpolyglutamate synthase/dihydrofolate synthase family protein [Temperatibacter marinus]WND03937.1 folylpolyglutamate synthase/dihydrofolate synthase family protein [Temperatibacter marinus]
MNEIDQKCAASDAILTRLMSLHPKVIDLSLGRLMTLLKKLGNPQNSLPPVIHIAGTNGKGSTTATFRAIAEAAGHRVHAYTSPHLVRFHERIRLAGQLISETYLSEILQEVEEKNAGDSITYFEVTTAAALLAFSRTPADFCILEVGLGGRLDATNVIPKPALTCITPVSMDHEQFLGHTLEAIAKEKAGIIKEDTPLIVGPQQGPALQAIAREADIKNAPTSLWNKHYEAVIHSETGDLIYEDAKGKLVLPQSTLHGRHQIMNAAMAIAIARTQKALSIPESAIKAGLGWVRWPARLQEIEDSLLNDLLPDEHALWLDGGHNPAAAVVIKKFIHDELGEDLGERPVFLILGMMGTKDATGYLKNLTGTVNQVIAVDIPGEENAAAPAFLAAAATDVGIHGTMATSVTKAIEAIAEQTKTGPAPFILLGGSLYLAGSILREIGYLPD